MDIEDFNEELNFKPLTKGLGFHNKKNEKNLSIPTTDDLKLKAASLAEALQKAQLNSTVLKNDQNVDRGDLTPFYSPNKTHSLKEFKNENEVQYLEASVFRRFCAWFIDVAIVSFLFVFTLSFIFLSSFNNFEVLMSFLIEDEAYWFFLPVYFLFYIFYFSFMEKTQFSTIGKSLLKIRVVDELDNPLSLYKSFFRAMITLFNLFTLGLGSLLDFQGRLTASRVIKNETYL